MKKRERQKVAETNRIIREKTSVEMTGEIDRILSGIQGSEDIKEKERDRQMERIKAKLKTAKGAKGEKEVVEEILENYNDTQLAFERDKKQQEKRFLRVKSSKIGSANSAGQVSLNKGVRDLKLKDQIYTNK